MVGESFITFAIHYPRPNPRRVDAVAVKTYHVWAKEALDEIPRLTYWPASTYRERAACFIGSDATGPIL